jgi:hypothetical protein
MPKKQQQSIRKKSAYPRVQRKGLFTRSEGKMKQKNASNDSCFSGDYAQKKPLESDFYNWFKELLI